jgi:hypothetical protein
LLAGFTTMFLGDILWALGRSGGGYLPGGLQDVLYVACYLPIAIAPHAASCAPPPRPSRPSSGVSHSLARALPYTAMLVQPSSVLVYVARAEVSGPVAEMTVCRLRRHAPHHAPSGATSAR